MKKRVEIKVSGLVQGVFFRRGAKAEAERRGLTGFARNEPDGSVRIVVEGEEGDLRKLVEWARVGTEFARVEKVEVEWQDTRNEFDGFEIL